MKTAGIYLDNYKAPTFRKNLKKVGFTWTEHEGLTPETMSFKVKFDPESFDRLSKVIALSNQTSISRN